MDGEKQSNRSHRAPKSGNKAEKKGTAKKLPDRGQNPKVRYLVGVVAGIEAHLSRGEINALTVPVHFHHLPRHSHENPPKSIFIYFLQAFAPASGRRAEKQARRNVEKDQTRLHVPLVDRTFGGTAGQGGKDVEGDIPPVIIAVMGPAGVSTIPVEYAMRMTVQCLIMSDFPG